MDGQKGKEVSQWGGNGVSRGRKRRSDEGERGKKGACVLQAA